MWTAKNRRRYDRSALRYSVNVEPERGTKESRADSFAAQCEHGFVKLVGGPWNPVFVEELCAFPNGAHDDQVDAASAAFRALSRPAELLAARFEAPSLIDIVTRRTAEDLVKDVGALPLLSCTLDDMWTQMVKRGDGTVRLPAQTFELGGVLVDRANTFLATHPGAEEDLRRILTLHCATMREDGEPTWRRALRSEFSEDEWSWCQSLLTTPIGS